MVLPLIFVISCDCFYIYMHVYVCYIYSCYTHVYLYIYTYITHMCVIHVTYIYNTYITHIHIYIYIKQSQEITKFRGNTIFVL